MAKMYLYKEKLEVTGYMLIIFNKSLSAAVFAFLFLLVSYGHAFAYLDPGTGSMILQGILGGLAAVVVAGKIYWRRIKGFFGFNKDMDQDSAKVDAKIKKDDRSE